MLLPYFKLAAIVLSSVALASPKCGQPIPPSQDPFYTAPEAFEYATPGTVLRQRKAPGSLSSIYKNCSTAYNLLYRTTGAQNEASWAVTTLLIPKTSSNALLSFQAPYNTPNVDESPSYTLYSPEGYYADIDTALGQGWFVNVPDHEGHNAAFVAAIGSGYATIDSVRAVLSNRHGLAHGARYAMWGYSGGSIASEVAAELQPQYAPELHFAGAALGGLPSDMFAVFDAVTGTFFAGLIPLAFMGLGNEYPAVRQYVESQLKTDGPYNKTGFLAAQKMGFTAAFATYNGQSIWDYFVNGRAVLNDPVLANPIRKNGIMGTNGTPTIPMFIYKAIHDQVTPINTTDALVGRYCKAGVEIAYQRNTAGTHLEEMVNGAPSAVEWLGRVLDGTYKKGGCVVKDVTIGS